MTGFQSFFEDVLHHFLLSKLAATSIRVKEPADYKVETEPD